jgi:hypothetical protein
VIEGGASHARTLVSHELREVGPKTRVRHEFALSNVARLRERVTGGPHNLPEHHSLQLRQDVAAKRLGVRNVLRPQSPMFCE